MTLNRYRDEAAAFVQAVGDKEGLEQIIAWLEEELGILKTVPGDRVRLSHQVYDMLFLLFELAAKIEADLDREWETGPERKRAKYIEKRGGTTGHQQSSPKSAIRNPHSAIRQCRPARPPPRGGGASSGGGPRGTARAPGG